MYPLIPLEAMQTPMLRLAVVGDPLLDIWVEGAASPCPDGCNAFREGPTVITPGGAANAARQLEHWPGVEVQLIGPVDRDVRHALAKTRVGLEYAFTCPQNPVKRRCVAEDGRVLWRCDKESRNHGLDDADLRECRNLALKAVRQCRWDAVLISDYGKGFFTAAFAGALIDECRRKGVPVVADSKLHPSYLEGAVLQANAVRAGQLGWPAVQDHRPAAVVTCGAIPPVVFGEAPEAPGPDNLSPVVSRNHIGAGDCFGAWLAHRLAMKCNLPGAAAWAHAAGRVFVQHPYGRPPWPHEVRKDRFPTSGKNLTPEDVPDLRRSLAGKRVVFTNGVFRIGVTAGHCWLLDWARKQGDALVVGVNDNASAARLRNGKAILPLDQRVQILSGLACVDWVVPFEDITPTAIIEALQPDVLCKGSEYVGQRVPGDDVAGATVFAPP